MFRNVSSQKKVMPYVFILFTHIKLLRLLDFLIHFLGRDPSQNAGVSRSSGFHRSRGREGGVHSTSLRTWRESMGSKNSRVRTRTIDTGHASAGG